MSNDNIPNDILNTHSNICKKKISNKELEDLIEKISINYTNIIDIITPLNI
jgi:hypothetical protein